MAAKSNLTNMVLVLGATCLFCSAILGGAYVLTKEPIEAAAAEKTNRAIAQVLPAFETAGERQFVEALGKDFPYYEAKNGEDLAGYAIESTVVGFGGNLTLMVGITPDRVVYNTSVLAHSETPGLGAKCTSDAKFVSQWKGFDPSVKKLFVKKDGGNVTWRIGSLGTDETFVGQITNGIEHNSRIGLTNIVKEGEGYWRLTGAQKYRGTTQITGGTLIQNGTHSQDKDYNNTYFTPGQYTVEDGATLAGKGSTMAPVVVKNGGTLAPGDFGIGTLTIKNNVTLDNGSILLIEVDRSKQTQDKLACEGTLTTNGELHIQLTDGTFAIGDVITIMSAKTYKGCFTAISPAQPAEGLAWDLSELFTKGQISIVASTATGITTPDVIPDGNNSDINAYLPDGTPAPADAKGIVIIRERRADGTIQTKKTIRK